MDFEKEARDLAAFIGDASGIEKALRRAFAAGQENMRKHLAEHFYNRSEQEQKNIYTKLSKVVAEFIEEFQIQQN